MPALPQPNYSSPKAAVSGQEVKTSVSESKGASAKFIADPEPALLGLYE
jgi:hypothetical protein